jgi:hypothetical protein
MRCQAEAFDRSPPKPMNGAFVVCNNIFSRSEVTPEVQYDPYLYFDQEEITYSARLWTHGWDIFSPSVQLLYHYYNTGKSVRPLHWTDFKKDKDREKNERMKFFYDRGLRRFNHLTRYQASTDPKIIVDIEKYGFGKARTIEQYEEYTGIDFKRKIASEKALRGLFIKGLAAYRERPVFIPELDETPQAISTATKVSVSMPEKNTIAPVHAGAGTKVAAQVAPAAAMMKPPIRSLPVMLEPGDFIPFFHAKDTAGSDRAVEVYAGKFSILIFVSSVKF